MCAINHKHHVRVVFDFYTSLEVSKETFKNLVYDAVLEAEIEMNAGGAIRCHASIPGEE